MSVRTVRRVEVTVRDEVVAIQCNVCGKEKSAAEHGIHEFTEDMHTVVLGGGWGDRYPGDMQTIRFATCGDCLFAWTQTFKVPVESTHSIYPSDDPPTVAIHSETLTRWLVHGNWAYSDGTEFKEPDTYEDLEGEFPAAGFVWEHFKGRRYQVLGIVRSCSDPTEVFVMYQALYEDSKVFIRPLTMWSEQVPHPDHGHMVPRFRPLG